MSFDIVLFAFACSVVLGPLLAYKLLNRFVDWIERKQFERLVDRQGEAGR